MEYLKLNNGLEMPAVGYGVFRIPDGETCVEAVAKAIECGYRMIDTAQGYWNEQSVGQGIRASGIDRKELFLTTKVWMSRYGDNETYQSVMESMKKLGTDYIDLVLIHQAIGDYYGAWRALERLYAEGKVRAIGVSNFNKSQIADLCLFNETLPMINQIEVNPFTQQYDMVDLLEKYKIRMAAWSPLGAGDPDLLRNSSLLQIGKRHSKSAAQVILRWLYQRGIVSVTKSLHEERIKENLEIFNFELSQEEMALIDSMNLQDADTQDCRRAESIEGLKNVIDRENYHFEIKSA